MYKQPLPKMDQRELSSPNTTRFESLRLRRRGMIEDFMSGTIYYQPVTLCNECWCAYCVHVSKGYVCLRMKGVMIGACICPGCRYKLAVINDTIARREDLLAKVQILQGKSFDMTTNLILRYVLRFLVE